MHEKNDECLKRHVRKITSKKKINKRTGASYKKVKFFCFKGETFEDKCVNDKKLQTIFLNSQS